MSNYKNREGNFYASNVRMYLNEYGGVNLEEFCKAEGVSYQKMCNSLGRPSYRKPSNEVQTVPKPSEVFEQSSLKPLIVDSPSANSEKPKVSFKENHILTDATIRFDGIELHLGSCGVSTMVSLLRGLEAVSC